MHWLIRSVAILKRDYPDVKLRIARSTLLDPKKNSVINLLKRNNYSRYLSVLIRKMKLWKNVIPLGNLDENQMAQELKNAHVFVLPSEIENSPNSLAEAMLVGTPSVVSFVGGTQSMIKDGETALCFPRGDYAVMAECIKSIFSNDSLAVKLSDKARDIAHFRHCRDRIASDTVSIYHDIIKKSKMSS